MECCNTRCMQSKGSITVNKTNGLAQGRVVGASLRSATFNHRSPRSPLLIICRPLPQHFNFISPPETVSKAQGSCDKHTGVFSTNLFHLAPQYHTEITRRLLGFQQLDRIRLGYGGFRGRGGYTATPPSYCTVAAGRISEPERLGSGFLRAQRVQHQLPAGSTSCTPLLPVHCGSRTEPWAK